MTSSNQCANLAMVFPGQGSQSVGMLAELAGLSKRIDKSMQGIPVLTAEDIEKSPGPHFSQP